VTVTIALTRAQDDAEATAAALRLRGFAAAIAPAIEIRAVAAALPAGRFDALIATSPRAIFALDPGERARFEATPLHVAGERTAQAARDAGLMLAGAPAADSATLVGRVAAVLTPSARVLYLAGRDRKPTLEAAFAASGAKLEVVALYAAEAREAWSAREARAIAGCTAALHYSRRTATLALALATRAGLAERFRTLVHVCLAADVAEPLRTHGAERVAVAEAPDEPRLLTALERALRPSPEG